MDRPVVEEPVHGSVFPPGLFGLSSLERLRLLLSAKVAPSPVRHLTGIRFTELGPGTVTSPCRSPDGYERRKGSQRRARWRFWPTHSRVRQAQAIARAWRAAWNSHDLRVVYRSVRDLLALETLVVGGDGLISTALCHYTRWPEGEAPPC